MAPRNVRFSSGSPDKLLILSRHDMQRLTSLDEDQEMLTEDDLPDTPSSPLREPPFELSPAQTTRTTRPEPSFQSPGSPRSPLIEPAWESFAPSPSSSSPLVEPPWDSISTRLSDSTPLLEPAWDKSPPPVSPGTPLHEPALGVAPTISVPTAHIYPTQAAGQSSRPLILLHEPQFRSLTALCVTSPSQSYPGSQPNNIHIARRQFPRSSSTYGPFRRSCIIQLHIDTAG
ncbi:hypothetical protein BKA82DRAFT_4358658 [Pisolithus tinctorius]|nr:hypothetical protein BKA82DRAFT_4358658 [Pisolithus tinctorius]